MLEYSIVEYAQKWITELETPGFGFGLTDSCQWIVYIVICDTWVSHQWRLSVMVDVIL